MEFKSNSKQIEKKLKTSNNIIIIYIQFSAFIFRIV